MSRKIGIGIIIIMVLAGAMALMAPPLCAEEITLPDPETVTEPDATVAAGDIVSGGAIYIESGGHETVYGTLNAGTVTLGTETTGGSITIETGGIVNVTNLYDTDKTVSGNRNALNIGEGGTLNVAQNLEIGGTGSGGCLGGLSAATHVDARSGAINLTGTGNLAGSGGCFGDVANPLGTVSLAADGQTTTITGSTAVMHLETGSGVLTGGDSKNLMLMGDSTTAWDRGTGDVILDALMFNPASGLDTAVTAGDYSQVGTIGLVSWFGERDTTFTLQGDIVGASTDIALGKDNDLFGGTEPTSYQAILDLNGHDVDVRNIVVGANEIDGNGNPVNPTTFASLVVPTNSSVTASDSLIVYKGSTLTLDPGTTVTADQVSLLGNLDNSGIITGVSLVTINPTGYFVNNGAIQAGPSGSVVIVVDPGAVLSGSASYVDTTIQVYGNLNTGNSPGMIEIGSGSTLQLFGGGASEWELYRAAESGPGTGDPTNWDYWKILAGGDVDIQAASPNDYFIDIFGWTGTEQGEPIDFDRLMDYSWLMIDVIDASQFTNGFSADDFTLRSHISGAPSGNFFLSQDAGGDVYMNYNGVPEPATMVGLAAMLLGAGARRFLRKGKKRA